MWGGEWGGGDFTRNGMVGQFLLKWGSQEWGGGVVL